MPRTSPKKPKANEVPQSYMVRFVCEFVLEGDVFVTAKKSDAAKVARKQLAALGYKEVDELALYRKRKTRTGRVISEQAVEKFLAKASNNKTPNQPPTAAAP